MIVKGIRLRSSSSISRTIRHLRDVDDNDAVVFVKGTPADIRDMHHDAVSAGSKYAVRHWIVAPREKTTREQMVEVVANLSKEFGFDVARAVIVEHQKRRSTVDATDFHWHVLVGEVDPTTGRILPTSFDLIKHELIARIAESSFGHAFVVGRHTDAVLKRLRRRGLDSIAVHLQQSVDASAQAPKEAFTHARQQKMRRIGLDLPAVRQAVKRAVNGVHTRENLLAELAKVGLDVQAGDKPETWILIEKESGATLGALHRLAGHSRSDINSLMGSKASSEHRFKMTRASVTKPSPGLPEANPKPATAEPRRPVSADRLLEELASIERAAANELEREMPIFLPTPAMDKARDSAREASSSLARAVGRRSNLDIQIATIRPLRWWSHLTGWAARRRQQIVNLEAALEDVQAEVRHHETALSIYGRKLFHEEKAAKDAFTRHLEDFLATQEAARRDLELVGEARRLLRERPSLAEGDLAALLAETKLRVMHDDDQGLTPLLLK